MITAANTMGQLQLQLDVIGHNLSNTNTTGYKARDASFNDMLYQQVNNQEDKGTEKRLTPAGIRQGTGAYLGQTSLNMTQGAFQNTDKLLDVAASNPNVYFQVAVNDSQQPVQYREMVLFILALKFRTMLN
jgi:flagellar basal-body rod protein FlgG